MLKKKANTGMTVLTILAVIAIVGFVLVFSGKGTGGVAQAGASKVYGGAIKQADFPYLEGRTVGTYPEQVKGREELAYQTGVPYRTYSREPRQIYSYVRTGDRVTGAAHANLVPLDRTLCASAVDDYIEICSGSNANSGVCSNLRSNILANCIGSR